MTVTVTSDTAGVAAAAAMPMWPGLGSGVRPRPGHSIPCFFWRVSSGVFLPGLIRFILVTSRPRRPGRFRVKGGNLPLIRRYAILSGRHQCIYHFKFNLAEIYLLRYHSIDAAMPRYGWPLSRPGQRLSEPWTGPHMI